MRVAVNVLQVAVRLVSVIQLIVIALASRVSNSVRLKLHGIELEVRKSNDGFWGNDRVIFYTDPTTYKTDILQYLYNEDFITDRRTPYTILELS